MLTHICISDLHAGAPNSLLMDREKTGKTVSVMDGFAIAIGHFLKKAIGKKEPAPKLVLLGDVLDLQFSDRQVAMQNAKDFLTALSDTGQFNSEVIATAGNHDHALWSDARLGLELTGDHSRATPAFAPAKTVQSRMLEAVLSGTNFKSVDFRYPNIGFANKERAVVLHHGHFAEAEYLTISHLISKLNDRPNSALTVEDISAENAGWIDFLWPSISEAGRHKELSDIYQMMLTPTGFRRISANLAEMMTHSLSEALPMSGNLKLRKALHLVTRMGLDVTLGKFRDSARYYETAALSPSGIEDLRWYIEGPTAKQLTAERGEIPNDVTFVFGHTHKPFAQSLALSGYPKPVNVFNTGGWTLNGPRFDNREAASMILIDDALNVASVQIFGTPQNDEIDPPKVTILTPDNKGAADFEKDINTWIKRSKTEWKTLTKAADGAYRRIQETLIELTEAEIAKQAKDDEVLR